MIKTTHFYRLHKRRGGTNIIIKDVLHNHLYNDLTMNGNEQNTRILQSIQIGLIKNKHYSVSLFTVQTNYNYRVQTAQTEQRVV